MAQALVRCVVKNPSGQYTMPYFKTKYTSSDFSEFIGYTLKSGTVLTSSDTVKFAKESEIQSGQGDPCISVVDGNVVIQKSGTYILEAHAQFFYPTGFSPSYSYQYIEYVALMNYKDKQWVEVLGSTDRACGSVSYRHAMYVTNATAGDILNMQVGQNCGYATMVNVGLNAYRLG